MGKTWLLCTNFKERKPIKCVLTIIKNMPSYSLPELKQIMKDNKLDGGEIMNKPEMLKLLHEKV